MEPQALILMLLLLLAIIVGARGPITKALGTAGSPGAATASSATEAGTPPAAAVAGAVPGQAPAAVHVSLHPAHNPFAARVSERGNLLPFAVPPAGWSLRSGHAAVAHRPGHGVPVGRAGHAPSSPVSAPQTTTTPPQPAQTGSGQVTAPVTAAPSVQGCASRMSPYTVRAGDSLWSIAGQQLPPTASNAALVKRVHRIYVQNRRRIGADPSIVSAGAVLCVPAH